MQLSILTYSLVWRAVSEDEKSENVLERMSEMIQITLDTGLTVSNIEIRYNPSRMSTHFVSIVGVFLLPNTTYNSTVETAQ